MNRLCRSLGIRIPILQAPTGSIAGPELAAAVSKAGALGSMGLTWTDAESIREQISWIREQTDAPFAVNFVLWFQDLPLIASLEAGSPIVTFSWGIPTEQIELVRSFGAKIGIQIGNEQGAARAVQLDPDFLICQGTDAGGHVQSTRELNPLLEAVFSQHKDMPIVAAGGIADGAGIASALRSGADGVMLGTRFVATRESRAHEIYKQRILQSRGDDTAITVCFDGGWPHAPHRVLRNQTLETWESAGCPPPGRRPGEADIIAHTTTNETIARYEDTAPRVGMTGNLEEMALYCGTGAGMIQDIPPAGELVGRLWAEALAAGAPVTD